MGLNTEIIEKQLAVFRNAQIKRRSALPVYLQIAEFLAQYMESADGRSDGRFPAEPDMAKAFHVSRETVRAALGRLEEEHKICRVKKRGTVFASQMLPFDSQSPRQNIGVVWPEGSNAKWRNMLRIFQDAAKNGGYSVQFYFYCMGNETAMNRQAERSLAECFGTVFYPSIYRADPSFQESLPETAPLVLFDVPPQNSCFSSVIPDHQFAGYVFTRELLARGCSNPGMARRKRHRRACSCLPDSAELLHSLSSAGARNNPLAPHPHCLQLAARRLRGDRSGNHPLSCGISVSGIQQ